MRLYLIGYMFCGKSTIGKQLARRMDYDFMDLDDTIEKRYHISVNDLFQRYGETAFRQLEASMLMTTAKRDNIVVACGGGTPCHYNNMLFIRQQGYSIYLKLGADDIMLRYKNSRHKQQRPLLQGLTPSEIQQYITAQLAAREEYYSQADLTIDAFRPSPSQIVENIMRWTRTIE